MSARTWQPALIYNGNEYTLLAKVNAVSVALSCPMGLRPGAGGCGSAILIDSQESPDSITSDQVVTSVVAK
jgi:hypothetical protein